MDSAPSNGAAGALYEATQAPLVVGRVASLPVDVARDVYASPDPLAAVRVHFANDAFARQALAVATPSLARAVDGWVAGQPLQNRKTPLRALAYLVRMASRSTPFGLCAGIGEVPVGGRTTLALDDRGWRSFTRPDMGLMLGLAESAETSVRPRVSYIVNECAFERGGRLYVVNLALTSPGVDRASQPVTEQRAISLKATAAVQFVRELCREPTTYAAITAALSERFSASADDSARLLDRLIHAGIVLSELRPSPLGNPVAYLHRRLVALGAPFSAALTDALGAARELDATPFVSRDGRDYVRVHDQFSALLDKRPSNALQIDLRAEFSGTLGARIVGDAARLAELLVRCQPVLALAKLRRRFEERYEGSERMVPLLELVDPNLGLGVPDAAESAEDTRGRDTLVTELACDALRSLAPEVELDARQRATLFPDLRDADQTLSSLEIAFQVAAPSLADIEAGSYLVVPSGLLGSTGATKSLGRFMGMFDDSLVERARAFVRADCDPEELTAELAFAHSESRLYNLNIRPLLLDYEVRSGIGEPPSGNAISPTDLWVGLDHNGFFLWSRSHARRVAMRETHLFATTSAAPNLCRFLGLLELDGRRTIAGFPWGAADRLTYLPRVRVGRVVLSLRRWSFSRAALGKDAATAARSIERWRREWAMPRYVFLTDYDRRLLVDLESTVAPGIVLDQSERERTIFHEALPSPEQAWFRGATGAHTVEFVAAMQRTRRIAQSAPTAHPELVTNRKRYGAGSAWTYGRVYLASQAEDNLLVMEIAPLIERMRKERLLERWFFVRYADPGSHLRIRLLASQGNAGPVRDRFLATAEHLLAGGQLERYLLDTYDPEYERYGGPEGMDAVERFFEYDSDACLGVIRSGSDATDSLIADGAAVFDGFIRAAGSLDGDVIEAFVTLGRRRLNPADRNALARVAANEATFRDCPLTPALGAASRGKRLRDLLHMHCNRLGLSGESEARVATLVRALARARVARTTPKGASAPS